MLTNQNLKNFLSKNIQNLQKSFTIIISLFEQIELFSTSNQIEPKLIELRSKSTNQTQLFPFERKITISSKDFKIENLTNFQITKNFQNNSNYLIDKFVATESEISPNLATNSSKLWTRRFSRGLKSSLDYRFR